METSLGDQPFQDLLNHYRQPDPIYVVRPSLPPLEKYEEHLQGIWDRRWLTNDGPCHIELEERLSDFLGVENISLMSSGTMALLLMLHAQRITSGEVITTPFTFPASTHILHWNGAQPVFCDIDPKTCNLDPNKVQDLITPNTKAILAVHVYGMPCDVEAMQTIADRYGLMVMYDTAHAFGVKYKGNSICNYGEMSALSFHATKLYSTCEGGAIVCRTAKQKERVNFLKNFGIFDEETVIGPGINGKMNELCAAYGLLQLDMVDDEIAKRGRITQTYRRALADVPGITVFGDLPHTEHNYAYFPILIGDDYGLTRDELHTHLKSFNIVTRKYFYPLCSSYSCYSSLPSAAPGHMPVAERVAQQVLCLPMFGTLSLETAETIATLIRELPGAMGKA